MINKVVISFYKNTFSIYLVSLNNFVFLKLSKMLELLLLLMFYINFLISQRMLFICTCIFK